MGANKKEKEVRWEKKGIERREIEQREGRRGRKREKIKNEFFSAFRRLKLDGPRRKVDPRIASYAWVPKS